MDTKLATNTIRSQQWAAIIKDRIESGLKVTDYCELHHLSKTQYYYWLKKIREQVIETQMPQLVEIQQPLPAALPKKESISGFVPEMTINIGNIKLDVNSNTSPDLIKMVLGVIANA